MRDSIGNRLEQGNLVWLQSLGMFARVVKAHDGGLSIVDHKRNAVSQPLLTIEIDLPLNTKDLPPGAEPQAMGVIRIVDPRAESLLDNTLKQ